MTTKHEILSDMIALDIETEPVGRHPQEYALQPWRLMEGKARISCIGIAKLDGQALLTVEDYRSLLKSLAGKWVPTYNGVFDVAWLISQGLWIDVKAINWIDVMLLWKWGSNSQRKERMPKWSLADCAKHFFKEEPWCEAFVQMKHEEHTAGDSAIYWETRAKADAVVTAMCCAAALDKLTPKQIKSACIEAAIIPEIARSWVIGVPIDYSKISDITPVVTKEMCEIEIRLGVKNAGQLTWAPSKVLRSPKQLGELIYGKWKLIAKSFSDKTGAPSTDKAALTYLADADDRALDILRWRELNTQLTKYLESPVKARKYLGSDIVHPSPKLFSTYTGRMTYSSKTSRKYATGVALHQWPRNKAFRALIKPPKGFKHVEYDAAGQESRIMAEKSGDIALRTIFTQNLDFHSATGALISGMSYEAFMEGKAAGNTAIVGEHGHRYAGKFCNLSQNFRVGVSKMRIQARVQYGLDVEFMVVKGWQTLFQSAYPGIKKYWGAAIQAGKDLGYAETLGGRRFKLDFWSKDDRWSTESSALMFPIQGTGADMKELGLRELAKHYPEQIFWFDLHDGLHMLVPEDYPDSKLIEARGMLDALDYTSEWGYTPEVPLTWDVSVGANWSLLKEL